MEIYEHQEREHTETQSGSPRALSADSAAIDELRNEILNSISKERRAPLAFGSITVSVVLGLLALISFVQVAQSASLYNKLKSSGIKPTAAAASGAATSLPGQVGGC